MLIKADTTIRPLKQVERLNLQNKGCTLMCLLHGFPVRSLWPDMLGNIITQHMEQYHFKWMEPN